ncbi:hypothetical protein ACFL6Y_10430 [Elusimicrobiota bacterium]
MKLKMLLIPFICAIISSRLCAEEFETGMMLGDDAITVRVLQEPDNISNPIVYFVPRNGDDTASKAARDTVRKLGGRLVELIYPNTSFVPFAINNVKYTFNPGMIFTEQGLRKTLNTSNEGALGDVQTLAQMLFEGEEFLAGAKAIVEVRNNRNKGFGILTHEIGNLHGKNTKSYYANTNWDEDDFLYVNNEEIFYYFMKKGINVVLQDNNKVQDNGSLAARCKKSCAGKHVPYIKVEAQTGNIEPQKELLESVAEYLEGT